MEAGTQPFGPRGERYQTKNGCREINLKQSACGRGRLRRPLHNWLHSCAAQLAPVEGELYSELYALLHVCLPSQIWKSLSVHRRRAAVVGPAGCTAACASSYTASRAGCGCTRDIANLERSVSWRDDAGDRGSDPVHARSQLHTTWSAAACADAGTNSYPGSPGCGFPSVDAVSNAGTEYTNWGAKLVFRVVPKEPSSS